MLEPALTVGLAFTVMLIVYTALEHPFAPMPLTLYTVVAGGDTVTDVPLNAPGFHAYTFAPCAFNVVAAPAQRVDEVADTFSDGVLFTDTVDTAEFVHPPSVFVPVTVYIVVPLGETVTTDPVNAPGFQV